jgi:hypothetical protein
MALGVALTGAALAGPACSDRSAPAPGGDGGPPGDIAGGGCSVLDQQACIATTGCQWHRVCPTCEDPTPEGSCGLPEGPIPDVACPAFGCPSPSCAGLPEDACKASTTCRADYCQECSCTPTYVGCSLTTDPPPACPALGCAPQCDCASLDEATCRANADRCTVAECPTCNGGMMYAGCYDLGTTIGCGLDCAAPGCRSNADCTVAGELCAYPGMPVCGACAIPPDACTADSDCQPGSVCAQDPSGCACGPGCVPACQSDADCQGGESCQNGHCGEILCAADSDCPPSFACSVGTTTPICERRACGSDLDCDPNTFCVDGRCYEQLGTCQPPAQ